MRTPENPNEIPSDRRRYATLIALLAEINDIRASIGVRGVSKQNFNRSVDAIMAELRDPPKE